MTAILFNGAEPFEQIVSIPSTEGHMWNLVKIPQAVSEMKVFKTAQMCSTGARADKPQGSKF